MLHTRGPETLLCMLMPLPAWKPSFTVTCLSLSLTLSLALFFFRKKDFFLLSVCTGPKKMGYFSTLKNSPHSKGMEDIIARGYSNTGELSKLTWECKIYKRNDIDTDTVSSILCPLLHFFAGESDAKNALVFYLFLHVAEVDLQTVVIFGSYFFDK